MLLTLVNWVFIGGSAFLWGGAILEGLKKINQYKKYSIDTIILVGLCALTVFAQTLSLFYRVRRAATIFLVAVDFLILILNGKKQFNHCRSQVDKSISFSCRLFFVLLLGLIILVLTSEVPSHYDTYLYHAQAIHWIEDYGAVPGLGNLHYRFAYNSAFLCLQALFSMVSLLGQSLHCVNGFVVWFLLSYAVCSMRFWRDKQFYASDFLRVAMFILYGDQTYYMYISSPSTDLFVLGLAVYILCKWVTLLEEGENEIAPYAYLCILSIYAMTLKLSVTMIVLLAIMPGYRLIKEKRIKELVVYLTIGMVTIVPFLARNIVISGYLLYPYPQLDLFDFDWKMSAYTLLFDQNSIKIWGQELKQINAPFSEWFPVWKEALDPAMYNVFKLNICCMIFSLFLGLSEGIRKNTWNFLHVSCTIMACFLFWFISAPNLRIGKLFIILLPLYFMGTVLQRIPDMNKENRAVIAMVVLGTYFLCPLVKYGFSKNWTNPIQSADYRNIEMTTIGWENMVVFIPVTGDQGDYGSFPSTPYQTILDQIEMRGDSLKEGFRVKQEYRDLNLRGYGPIDEDNIFEK